MYEVNEEAIEKAVKALLDAAPAGSKVILFGSRARGTARPDSDLDFLVVEPNVADRLQETFRLRHAVGEVFKDSIQAIDLVVTDVEHFSRSRDVPNSLAFEAAAEGRIFD